MTSDNNEILANKGLPVMLSDSDFGESDSVEMRHMASDQSSLGLKGPPTRHGTVPRHDVTRGECTHKVLPPTKCGPMSQHEVKGRVPSTHEGHQKGPGLDMVR